MWKIVQQFTYVALATLNKMLRMMNTKRGKKYDENDENKFCY